MTKADFSLEKLGKALDRLGEVLEMPLDAKGVIRDSAIQRFEMVIELYWETFKHLLEVQKVEVAFPKQALQKAYQAKWIDEEKPWIDMLTDRNETSHIYDEQRAQKIYERIRTYYPTLEQTYTRLLEIQ